MHNKCKKDKAKPTVERTNLKVQNKVIISEIRAKPVQRQLS